MFGEPDRRGNRPPREAVLEQLEWWADLFEIPCVGYVAAADKVGTVAATGADFVALGDWIWNAPQGVAAVIVAASQSLGETRR